MKRIGLYLGFPPEGGGAFQYAQSILAALMGLPHAQYQLVVAYSHAAWQAKLDAYGDRFERVPIQDVWVDKLVQTILRAGFPLSLWRGIVGYIHPTTRRLLKQSCDLWVFPAQDVWTYSISASTLGVIHDLMHRYERCFPEVSAFGLFHRRERHYYNLCKYSVGVVVDSNIGKCQVMESYSLAEERIHILPFVAPAYMHSEQIPANFDARYSLPAKFIFYPAQFWLHKNHLRLLQAMAKVRLEIPDLYLVLVGSKKNAYRNVIKSISSLRLTDRVKILGYVRDEDISVIYRRAQALIMPTFFGPTNIPPLEAMVAGCPMAISNIYAMPEQVGDAALLFNPESVDEIVDAIRRLLTDYKLRQQLIIAGKKQASHWGQVQFNQRFREIIESVLKL